MFCIQHLIKIEVLPICSGAVPDLRPVQCEDQHWLEWNPICSTTTLERRRNADTSCVNWGLVSVAERKGGRGNFISISSHHLMHKSKWWIPDPQRQSNETICNLEWARSLVHVQFIKGYGYEVEALHRIVHITVLTLIEHSSIPNSRNEKWDSSSCTPKVNSAPHQTHRRASPGYGVGHCWQCVSW